MQNTCFYLRCFKCSNFNKTWNNARCDFFFNHLMQWLPKLFWGITRTIKPHIDDWWMKRVRWERRVIVIFLSTIISWSCSCPSSTQFKEWCITFVPCSRDNVNYPILVKWLAVSHMLHQNDWQLVCGTSLTISKIWELWRSMFCSWDRHQNCHVQMQYIGEKSGIRVLIRSAFKNGWSLAF